MISVVLIIAYMMATHLAVLWGDDRLAVGSLSLLGVLILRKPVMRAQIWPWGVVLACVVLLVTLPGVPWARIALFVPPVAINVALAIAFGSSLRRHRVPVIERIVRVMHWPEEVRDPGVWPYARVVTLCWTLLFVTNAVVCSILALLAEPGGILRTVGVQGSPGVPTRAWSLYADVGGYVLCIVMFVIEFEIRRRRFPWQPYANFAQFVRRAIMRGPALAAELWRGAVRERMP